MLLSSADAWDPALEKHILATGKEIGSFAPRLAAAGYRIHHLYREGYPARHAAARALMRAQGFEIVHIHRQKEAFSYALDARLCGARRIVRTVHNVFVFHGLVQLREFAARQAACALGVRQIAIGKSVAENERARFGVRCRIIPNWYDETRFFYTSAAQKQAARTRLGIPRRCFCMVSVGGCSPVKNHCSILKALAGRREDDAFREVLYLHLGSGPQEEEEKAFARRQGIGDRVRFAGCGDPVPFLQAADLYLMPSAREGVSIAALEAIATGMPVLLTDAPGLRDFKEQGFENVRYCPPGDEALAEAIDRAVREGPRPGSPAQAEQARRLYGRTAGVAAYQTVYFEGLAGTEGGQHDRR